MHVISQKRLKEFWERYADAEGPLRAWWILMKQGQFRSSHDVKEIFAAVDFVGGGRAIFNVGGNKYRLIADIRYEWGRVYIVAVLTHAEYESVDVAAL
jgi:mRNA interferase HigB